MSRKLCLLTTPTRRLHGFSPDKTRGHGQVVTTTTWTTKHHHGEECLECQSDLDSPQLVLESTSTTPLVINDMKHDRTLKHNIAKLWKLS